MPKINKESLISAGFAIALILLALAATISASKVYEYAFQNNFNTGSVDIKLTQYQITDSGEKKEATKRDILPGEKISYIPEITNLRAPAYIRLKVDIIMDKEVTRPITTDNIFLINKGWVQKNNYFYYTKPVLHGEVKDAFQGIHVPDEWTNDDASAFSVAAYAEAIQAVNFTPDFSSNTPWGSVTIEKAKPYDSKDYKIAKTLAVTNELTFSGDTGLEANTKDLFREFQTYMAGDTYKDDLKIKNSASNPITVYFRTDNNNSNLVSKARLKISMGEDVVYEGPLLSSSLSTYRKLGKIKSGKSSNFKYTVTLPDDSMNEYSALADNVTWRFKVVEHTKSPKTGDNTIIALWLLAFMVSVLLLSALIRASRKHAKENDKKSE